MSSRRTVDLSSHRVGRILLFSALYFTEGAPIGFLWWALPTVLRENGAPVDAIGTFSAMLILPWTLKFLWSPLLDGTSGNGANLRTWIICSQILMGLALVPLAWLEWSLQSALLPVLMIVHAIAASTQDAAIDALAVKTVPQSERGQVNGWMQAGMLAGRGTLGGGSLLLIDSVGQPGVVGLLIASIWIPMMVLVISSPAQSQAVRYPVSQVLGKWKDNLRDAVSEKRVLWGFLFALLAGAGFEGVGSIAGPFLIDAGSSKETIARFFGIDAIVAMAIGALIGGRAADRFGKAAASTAFLILLSAVILCIAFVVGYAVQVSGVTVVLMTVAYFGIGCFLAASFAFFMDLTSPRHAATQFSFLMAGTNLCESWSAAATGQLVSRLGYPVGFTVLASLSLVALPVLRKGARFVSESLSPTDKSPS